MTFPELIDAYLRSLRRPTEAEMAIAFDTVNRRMADAIDQQVAHALLFGNAEPQPLRPPIQPPPPPPPPKQSGIVRMTSIFRS